MRNTIGFQLSLAGLATLLLASSSGVPAQSDDEFDRTMKDCILTSTVDRTYIVDDQQILFFMRGKQVYRNYLPRKCFGLKVEDRFAYRTTGRLCRSDSITVLEQSVFSGGGLGGFRDGQVCPLGDFQPITAEEAADLSRKPDRRDTRKKVKATVVELPAEKAAPPAEPPTEPADAAAPADQKDE